MYKVTKKVLAHLIYYNKNICNKYDIPFVLKIILLRIQNLLLKCFQLCNALAVKIGCRGYMNITTETFTVKDEILFCLDRCFLRDNNDRGIADRGRKFLMQFLGVVHDDVRWRNVVNRTICVGCFVLNKW